VKNATKYANSKTISLYKAVSRRNVENVKPLTYGRRLRVEGFEVTAYNAGHILGSTLFKVDTGEGVVVYTGDLNCNDTIITSAAHPIRCDILITESTFGKTAYTFPPRYQIYRHMVQWAVDNVKNGRPPVFYVYTLGKAQEIIKVLNKFTELDISVDPRIAEVNKVYAQSKIKLKAHLNGLEHGMNKSVLISPNYLLASHTADRGIPAVATGWALRSSWRISAFPLSSHADFLQLMNFTKESKPKKVYTLSGNKPKKTDLEHCIKQKLGIPARPMPTKPDLAQYF
jgi:Cft2 family RNA processing exonuclease